MRRTSNRFFGKLGGNPELARALAVTAARMSAAAATRRLEEVARQLGADLTDRDDFQVVAELARAA